MKIHTGDTVVVITGKDKGKTGKVMRVLHDRNRVVVEGINMRIKHIRKTAEQAGQKISFEASLSASNVMLLDPKTKKRTRVGYAIDAKGNKTRIAKVSGEILKTVSTVRAKSVKKGKDGDKKAAEKKDAKTETPSAPTQSGPKTPFWKRMGFGSQAQADAAGAAGQGDKDVKAAPTRHRSQEG